MDGKLSKQSFNPIIDLFRPYQFRHVIEELDDLRRMNRF